MPRPVEKNKCLSPWFYTHSNSPFTVTLPMNTKMVANMVYLVFYSCLRLGEYTDTTWDDQAFAIADFTLFVCKKILCNTTATDAEILTANVMHLTFATQKNSNKGTVVAHSLLSGHNLYCPVGSAICQLMMHQAEAQQMLCPLCVFTKLATYYNSQHINVPVTAYMITSTLRCHDTILCPQTGINPFALSACFLQ